MGIRLLLDFLKSDSTTLDRTDRTDRTPHLWRAGLENLVIFYHFLSPVQPSSLTTWRSNHPNYDHCNHRWYQNKVDQHQHPAAKDDVEDAEVWLISVIWEVPSTKYELQKMAIADLCDYQIPSGGNRGRMAAPNWMNFRKSSKRGGRGINPKIMLQIQEL